MAKPQRKDNANSHGRTRLPAAQPHCMDRAVQLTPSSTKGRKAKAAAGAWEEHFLRLELKEIILIVIVQISAALLYCAAWCLSGEQEDLPSPAPHWQKRGEL